MNFTKMHGLGNDYVYINCTNGFPTTDLSKLAKTISDRRFGIGSDGIILICTSKYADFRMRMFNSDGTEAEMCGNGIRCVGKYIYEKGLSNKTILRIETLSGIKIVKLNLKENKVESVTVDMGIPILRSNLIPVISKEYPVRNLKLVALDREFICTCVSMGNPHAVTRVHDLRNFDVKKYGEILEKDMHFPRKANIEFIEVVDNEHIRMRVWERGSGETYACGTGACAVAVAGYLNRYTKNNVQIELLGGFLNIQWNTENNHVYMTGNATTVYEGIMEV